MKAGDTLGAYVVVQELGSGGMGTVYLAQHSALGRRAAIKVLQPELTANQLMLTRFFNEAKAASAIKSPGIVEIYDFGRHVDGSAYIVMELLEGDSLAARLHRRERLPLPQALLIARQIASALAPAHRAGIVHRDLKPDNVFLVPDEEVAGGERVKLLDFGIAKLLGDGDFGPSGRLTTTKTVMGTPLYMSPEQCRGAGQVDERSDLYALGCILHELLTGAPPFGGEGAGDLIGAHIYLAPRPLRELLPDVPVEVEQLVQRLLAKNPAQRPQTAEDVAAELSALAARAGAIAAPSTGGTILPRPPRTELGGTLMAMEAPRPQRARATPLATSQRLALLVGGAALVAGIVYTVAAGSASGPSADPGADDVVKRKRAECAQLQGEERWVELKKCAGELLRAKGTTGDDVTAANDFSRQAGIEVTAKTQLEKFLTAQQGDDMRGMAAIARSFNEQSRYAPQVQERWESEKSKYVSSKMSAAHLAAQNGQCGELRGFASSVRPYDSRSADEITELSCSGSTPTAAVDCNDPAVAAAATSLYDEIQAARISDQKNTIRLTEQALANKCLANRRAALLRVGLYAACAERRTDKVEFFFAKANRDPTLISTCPALLGDRGK